MKRFIDAKDYVLSFIKPTSAIDKEVQELLLKQKGATSYEGWLNVSRALDRLLGNDFWKLRERIIYISI